MGMEAVASPMTTVDDLAAWLTQILDEEQAEAEAAAEGYGAEWVTSEFSDAVSGSEGGYVACGAYDGPVDEPIRYFIARHDPAAMLTRIAADRQILDVHGVAWNAEVCTVCHHLTGDDLHVDNDAWPCQTVRLLALPYADRPGFREEWRP